MRPALTAQKAKLELMQADAKKAVWACGLSIRNSLEKNYDAYSDFVFAGQLAGFGWLLAQQNGRNGAFARGLGRPGGLEHR